MDRSSSSSIRYAASTSVLAAQSQARSVALLQATLVVPFHQLRPVAEYVPPPSYGLGAVAAFELGIIVHEELDRALALPPEERPGLLGVFGNDIAAGEITEDEVKNILLILVSAGSETTATLMATACERLAGDERLQARLRADPSGVAEFLEDTLRDDGPFQFHYRHAPADTELGGVAIPAGSRVLLMWAAANRPAPGAPPAPDGPLPPHYAFGKGMHFCIGAPIARLEARLAIEQLLARTASIALVADDPPTRRPSIFLRRFARLPLVLAPA